LPLFPGHARRLCLEDFLERVCLRDAAWSQTDHANALRCKLGGQGSSECLLGGLRRAVAALPFNGVPVRAGIAVTVTITPDSLGTIRRAATRAVRKYDVV
jgi:hypothetical protein